MLDLQPPIVVPAASLPFSSRRDGWHEELQGEFLHHLAEHGVVSRAAATVGRGLSGVYALRERDAVFGAAWDAARLLAKQRLFDTLIERALVGDVLVTRRDGDEIHRERREYRLGLGMLDRLGAFAPARSPRCSAAISGRCAI